MRQYSMAVLTMSGLLAFGNLLAFGFMPVQSQTNPSGIPTEIAPKPSSDVYFINRAKNLARQAAITANGGLDKYRPNAAMYGPAVQTSYVNNSNGSITFTFTGGVPGAPDPSIETVATVMPDGSVNLDYNGAVRGISTTDSKSINPSLSPSVAAPSNPPSVATPSNPSSAQPIIPADERSTSSKAGLPNLSASTPSSSAPSGNPTSPTPTASPSNNAPSNNAPSNNSSQGTSFAASTADQDAFLSKARNIARQTAIKENGGLDRYRPEASMFGPSGQSPYVKNADGSVTFTFKGGSPGATVMTVESVVTVNTAGSPTVQYNGPVRGG